MVSLWGQFSSFRLFPGRSPAHRRGPSKCRGTMIDPLDLYSPSSVVSSPGTSPWAKPAKTNSASVLRQLAFSIFHAPGYYRITIYFNLWPGHTQSHSGLVRGCALFAEAMMFCGLTGAASWSGPSCFYCSCGRSAAANAALGIWRFSFAAGE